MSAENVAYWRKAYENLVAQTGRDLNDGLGIDPRRKDWLPPLAHTPPAPMEAVAAVDNAARGGIVWANSAVTLETGTPLYTRPPQPDAPCWRDIATAPRDGTDLLLWDGTRARFGSWRVDEGYASKEPMWLDDSYDDSSCGFASVPITPTHWQPLPPPPSADAKRSEPDALPGDLREKVARRAAAAILEQDGYSAVGPYLNADLTLDYLDQGEVDFGKVADAILSLIQSERVKP